MNCTTNSEDAAEAPVDGTCANPGEFDDQAQVIMDVYPAFDVDVLPAATQCDGYAKNTLGLTPTKYTVSLADFLSSTYNLGVAAPGEGICTKITMSLPASADNASQGDYVNFDADFLLTQV